MSYILTHAAATAVTGCWAHKIPQSYQIMPHHFTLVMLPFIASIFWESISKAEEVSLYLLPRYMDLVWNYLIKKKIVTKGLPYFHEMVFGLCFGIACHCYGTDVSYFF